MSSGGSDGLLLKGDRNSMESDATTLLEYISEITASGVCIGAEKERFIRIGCYLYRASLVILELQEAETAPANVAEILQSLSKSIGLAKDLVGRCQKGMHTIQNLELRNIFERLKEAINSIGEELSLMPSSAYRGQEYAELAVRSLSKEMKSASFGVSQRDISEPKELEHHKLSSIELSKEKQARMESDLYPIDYEVSMKDPELSDIPSLHLDDVHQKHRKRSSESLMTLPDVAQYMEPLYETFFCPLTKKIMDDPVTIESGVTYERMAITEWFSKFGETEEVICPKTGKKLVNKKLSTNMALKATIEEWEERNEAARIKVARAALSLSSTEDMVLEALDDLKSLCQRKHYNRVQVLNAGIVPLLGKFLEYKDRNVRCATLELLREMAEGDDVGKEMIAKTTDIAMISRMFSSNHQPIKHASMLLMLELSRYPHLCDKIGSVTGGILMLITVKYGQSIDAFAAEQADKILKNLEISPNNIRCMAENGYWEPLLNHLDEGSEEMKMEMANYLGKISVGHDRKMHVAKRASPALIGMINSGSSPARSAAFKVLKQISSSHSNGKILLEAGIVQIMVEEMFTRTIFNEPMNSKKAAAEILANVLESAVELENLPVSIHGHRMGSDYVVYNIIDRLKNSTPDDLNISLIRIFLCLMKSSKLSAKIVSVIKETDASYNLIELINNPNEEIGVASIKLLIKLSSYMGHTLIDKLCKTRGQPESLILSPSKTSSVTEKHSVAANFLAKLPHQNLTLNLALLNRNTVPIILQNIDKIQRTGSKISRYMNDYLEGLVGILVRFTTTLYDHQVLFLARDCNFTSVFTELLVKTSSDEVQRLSAIGLENLSSQSANLSRAPQIKRARNMKVLFLTRCLSFESSKGKRPPLCPIHRGDCSAEGTFCLLDARAVERLLTCLDHQNVEVVEAALSAICTLLDDKVDVDKSVSLLSELHAIQSVLNVLKEHKEESLRQKSFWMMEKFLVKGGDKSLSDISQDRSLPAILISAFHHADGGTRQMAEKLLRHLNKIPDFSANFSV